MGRLQPKWRYFYAVLVLVLYAYTRLSVDFESCFNGMIKVIIFIAIT